MRSSVGRCGLTLARLLSRSRARGIDRQDPWKTSAGAAIVTTLQEVSVLDLRSGGDTGQPMTLASPDSEFAKAFREIAGATAARVSTLNLGAAT